MDLPELLLRIHTLGEEPPAGKSISYHTDDSKLFDALRQALHAGEYEELKESKLGEMLGVDVDVGPTTEQIIAVFGRCEEWSRDDRMRLGYLAIFPGFIEGRNYGNPIPNRQSPVLLAYKGGKRRRSFKEAINRHTSMINFVQKDFGEMFPRWNFDAEDSAAENIIKVMFNAKPRWKWTMDCWEVTGTKPSVKKEVSAAETESGVKEENGRPRKKDHKEKSIEARAKASKGPPTERNIADAMRDGFGMCLKEIKLLGDRMEAVEKKVGITKKGTASNDLQITASSPPKHGHEPGGEARRQTKNAKAMEYVHGKSERERKLVASQQSPFKLNNTAKLIIPNKRVGQGYDPFAPIDKKMSKVLTDWVKLDPLNKGLTAKSSHKSSDKTLLFYMQHMDAFINLLRNEHWIAILISIPKKHIVVWDSIISHISREDLDVPYTYERVTVGVPQCQAGDCGVFTLKYIECHALGMSFPPEFCNKNAKAIREKMALDIFKETPGCHSKENEDNDENMGT
ncbi:hypothetical protein F2Q68_00026906 [Brassica cretica]|uniref:Ubiquitin-like protease family profile domain-containing protein n=2 Tax=Brassica cretica TaxID=69181 RepID=A0ABQ7DE98_BRACR|nr:hypothetical protein F2Q68_00026906 [Brassica cretica]KAF3576337.1 hypothetical protein DY000_02033624 [Brassica cretica]